MGPTSATRILPASGWDGKAIALELNRRAAASPLYGETKVALEAGRHLSWRPAPAPYAISPTLAAEIAQLGQHLLAFQQAANKLYFESVKGRQPAWVHGYLDQGKPEALIDYQRMNRFKKLTPMVIRPDLIVDEQGRLRACELDSVPGGIGLTGSMTRDYAGFGFSDMLGGADGLVSGFAEMIRGVAGKDDPVLAIVVSEEGNDYWHEQQWLATQLNVLGLETYALRPEALTFTEDGLQIPHEAGPRTADVIYRFYELFDLKNIPKAELVQYANKKQTVIVTPPYKAFMEEKMTFALFHHPALRPYWKAELGDAFAVLEAVLPKTWIVDPTPLPPHAVIPGLSVGDAPVTDWLDLIRTNKRERAYVLKPSGFSALAWGSHGVAFGHDLSTPDWEAALRNALASFPTTPYILQEFHKPAKTSIAHYHFGRDEVVTMEGRARLCPYYYVVDGQAKLAGMLTTVCPLDKLAIHGMTDAVMVPTRVDASITA